MPCPTCSHTLARLCVDATKTVFQCPRCGSLLVIQHGTDNRVPLMPFLVERVRALVKNVVADLDNHPGAKSLLGILDQLGITEAILLPEDRPA